MDRLEEDKKKKIMNKGRCSQLLKNGRRTDKNCELELGGI